VLTITLVIGAALVGACGEDAALKPADADSGSTAGAVGEGICPTTAPRSGESCVVPEGTTCAFGACGTPIARCLAGAWRYGGNPPPRPACPAPEPPASESACPPCWPAGVTCAYGSEDCSSLDASANRTVASCPGGVWVLQFSPCAALGAAPDASSEGGADVQRDAGPDVD
jgi:hypothetical protein